jgi:HemY protein
MKLLYRWLVMVIVIGLAAFATMWVQNHQGVVQIVMLGYQIEVPVWVMMAAFSVVILAVTMFLWALMRLKFWRKKHALQSQLRNKNKGLSEITTIISAFSVGDLLEAQQHLKMLAKIAGQDNALYQLLNLHLQAKQGGNPSLGTLEQYPETKFLSYSAKINEAIAQQDALNALQYAKQAYEMRPDNAKIALQYFGLLLQANDFASANAVLQNMRKKRIFAKEKLQELQAIAYYVEYEHEDKQWKISNGDEPPPSHDGYDECLFRAFEACPSFVPAFLHIIAKYSKKRAWKDWQKAWRKKPQPQLTQIMMEYFANEQIMKNLSKLQVQEGDIEVQLALANAAMFLKHYDVARNHLKAALAISSQRRVYELLAQLEENGFDDAKAASGWLKQMAGAQENPHWACTNCGHIHGQWQLQCDACHSFASVEFGAAKTNHFNTPLFYLQ